VLPQRLDVLWRRGGPSSSGQTLAFFGPNITPAPGGTWRFELSPLGQPARAEVILARDLERKVYPLTLTIK